MTSLQHPIVKRLVKLRQDREFRHQEKSVLIAGHKLVEEIHPYASVKRLFIENHHPIPPFLSPQEVIKVTHDILKKITGLQHPEPIAAEVDLPPPGDLKNKQLLLALDGVSDPGNLGTLLRTALSLGWEGVFLTPHCTDPFNEKALRAAKGATFRLPIAMGSWPQLQTLIQDTHCHVYVADVTGEPLQEQTFTFPLILILGNESHGVNPLAKQYTSLSIPMDHKMESLNVAIAGGIFMYHIGIIR